MKRRWILTGVGTQIGLCLFLYASARSDWSSLGLNHLLVSDLELYAGNVYAATSDGVFRRDLVGTDSSWHPLGQQGLDVAGLLVFHADTLLSSHVSGPHSFYRTTNAGQSWEPFDNGFGGGQFVPVRALARSAHDDFTLFASGGAVIAKSTDGGQSWRAVWGDWAGLAMGVVFITPDPYGAGIVWAGGEGAFFNPWLLKSTDAGETWTNSAIPYDGDNRCHDIAIYPHSSDSVWVSMEGKVIKTSNGGTTWTTPYTNSFYLYRIEVDTLRPDWLYMTGEQREQPLPLFASIDGGITWATTMQMSYTENGALDLILVSSVQTNTLYFATAHGVFSCTQSANLECGDANNNGLITSSDIIQVINFVFKAATPPFPSAQLGDADCSGPVDAADIIVLVNYVFKAGTPPCGACLGGS